MMMKSMASGLQESIIMVYHGKSKTSCILKSFRYAGEVVKMVARLKRNHEGVGME